MSEQSMEDVFRDAAAAGEDQAQAVDEPADTGTEEAPPAEFVLGTYRSLEEAERGIAEKDRLILERANEVGDLRRQLAEREAAPVYQQQPQQTQQFADDGPHQLTQAELMQVQQQIQRFKGEGLTEEALELQFNLSEVLRTRELYEQEQRIRGEFEQRFAGLEGPVRDSMVRSKFEEAMHMIGPDANELIDEFGREIIVETIEANPDILQQGGQLRPEQLARLVLGERELRARRGQASRPRDERGQFIPVQGGSGAEPAVETTPQTEQLEPGDPRLAFQHPVKRDAFGVIPSFDRA